MSLRLGALHDALLDPGNVDKAVRAAEEVAGYETRLASMQSDITLLKWMVTLVLGGIVGLYLR